MSVPGEKEIPIRRESQRTRLQNLLLAEIADTGTYQNSLVADLRPMLGRVREAHDWFQGKPQLSDIEAEIESQRLEQLHDQYATVVDARLTAYVDALDRFTGDTLGLRYRDEPALWARQAIHFHVETPASPVPIVIGATWEFWRDLTISVRVTDGYARAEARDHFGNAVDRLEINAPVWTSFNDWNEFTEGAVRLFRKHLNHVKDEAREEYGAQGMYRRLAGLIHEDETVQRLAKVLMVPAQERTAKLLDDQKIVNLRSEKQRIRNLCALIDLDSPFQRKQKKKGQN